MIRCRPFVIAALVLGTASALADSPVDWVDPFIGTEGYGNVFPGVSLPFAFIQVSPDTGPNDLTRASAAASALGQGSLGNSGAAGYKHDREIEGFSQQHISGMAGPVLGEISIFPLTGELENPSAIRATGKSDEIASPGFYGVTLAPWDVKVELTATSHVAFHRHTFPASDSARVLVDAGHVLYGLSASWSSAKPDGGEIRIDPAAREVSGHMTYHGGRGTSKWQVWFVVRFDTPFESFGTWDDAGTLHDVSKAATGGEIGAFLNFQTQAGQTIESRAAVSHRSLERARGYLDALPEGTTFESTHAAARTTWNETLGKITVEGGTDALRRQFTTALYRVHLTPNDWTGEGPARYDGGVYYENILCLWDTFRTVNPLLTLIQPEVQAGIVNTLLRYHQIDGWTGDAHSVHRYEHVQNGSNADVVIADAYVKNLPGIDWKAAYAAIRKNAFEDAEPKRTWTARLGRFRLDDYRRHGYLPSDIVPDHPTKSDHERGVSRTLEYAHNDFAVLTLARAFGTPEDVADLEKRALWYGNLWDPTSGGFMRGKNADGTWLSPFDPLKSETGRHYYEGHAWTWSWYVPHDPQGLINLHGSREAFVEKLTIACDQHYQAWNEPSMLQTYLFIHAGRPDLTQRFVRKALAHFNDTPGGLPGNDDSGTTSAWLVWALLGLYPNAGQDFYYIGSPSFTRATIKLPAGKTFVISSPAASPENQYIASATLNGKPWNQAWLRHTDLIDGGELVLEMVPEPTRWAFDGPVPHSVSKTSSP